jgi:hypothetical protein
MKIFRSTNSLLLATVLIVAALGTMTFLLNARSTRDSVEVATTLSATTGELATLYLKSSVSGIDKGYPSSALKDLVRRQAMILLTLKLDVREFDSQGFEGICRLASNRNLFFPISNEQNVEALSNKMLNSRFASLAQAISDESLTRSRRPADRHSCPGFP